MQASSVDSKLSAVVIETLCGNRKELHNVTEVKAGGFVSSEHAAAAHINVGRRCITTRHLSWPTNMLL